MAGLGQFFRGLASGIAPEVDQRRAMANAAILQLQGVNSPQAQHWMQQLHANPGQALAAAEAFGGIGAVSQGLQAAQAQARAQQEMESAARSAGLSDLERLGFRFEGGSGLKSVREAMAVGEQGEKDRKIVQGADGFKYYADTGERVLPGVAKSPDRRETVTDTLGRQVYLDTGQPVLPAEADMTMPRTEAVKIRTVRETDFKPYLGFLKRLEDYREAPEGAAGDFTRLQTLGKMLDEGSVVREGEAELMRVMGASSREELMRKVAQMWTNPGLFTQGARQAVNEAIEASARANATAAVNMWESWNSQNESLGMSKAERTRTLPYADEVKRLRGLLEDKSAPSKAEYEHAVQFWKSLGKKDDEITAEMLAEALEGVQQEDSPQPVSPSSRGMVPLTGTPRPAGAVSMEELMRITGGRR